MYVYKGVYCVWVGAVNIAIDQKWVYRLLPTVFSPSPFWASLVKRIGCGGLGGGAPVVVAVVAYLSRGEYRLHNSEGGIVLRGHVILHKMCSSPPQPNDQDNNHNYQYHCYKNTNNCSCNCSSITTSGGRSSTIYVQGGTCIELSSATLCLSHALLTGSISGGCVCLGSSLGSNRIWALEWENQGVRFYSIPPKLTDS